MLEGGITLASDSVKKTVARFHPSKSLGRMRGGNGYSEDLIFTPNPNPPDSLPQISVCNHVSTSWNFLLRRSWSGKSCSHCNVQGFPSLLRAIRFPYKGIVFLNLTRKERSVDLGVGGWKHDPDIFPKFRSVCSLTIECKL